MGTEPMTTERNAQGVDGLAEVMGLLKACAPGEWSVDRYAKQIFKIRGEMLPRGGARRCIATIGATTAYDSPALDVENEVNAQLIAAAAEWCNGVRFAANAIESALAQLSNTGRKPE